MTEVIDKFISEKKYIETLEQCKIENMPNLGILLNKIWKSKDIELPLNIMNELNDMDKNSKIIKVMVLCYWTSPEECCKMWNRQSKGDNTWNNIQLVSEEPADYYVIISSTTYNLEHVDPKKIIIFRMNPNMENQDYWEEYKSPDKDKYLFVGYHEEHFNNNEWWLSKTYKQLCEEKIEKNNDFDGILSAIISNKYSDPGHKKRVDFIKFVETKGFKFDVFGGNNFEWKDYKGTLPERAKDNGLFPYKYTFNVENFSLNGYFTEKLIDGILSECLTFYHGCKDISKYLDERAYVWLDLEDFEMDFQKIKTMIEEDEWSKRIDFIRKEKKKILNELQFFPRLEKIISNSSNSSNNN
jgi:hypothetical protein